MSKPLIIAEKPSAARAIAEALGGFANRTGYMESPHYRLTWAIGHLVELKSPEEYDARWKRWSLDSLPIIPASFGLKVSPKTRSQFEVIARLAREAPVLINACDAGREGELIFRYICQAAGVDRPVKRLWVSSLTREAIRKGFGELRPQADYERLYQSALCRSQGDWLIGMNATRAFTVKGGELLSVGRVQTPTLALIVRREREIEAFVPEPYWEVWAQFGAASPPGREYRARWFSAEGDRLKRAEDADAVVTRVQGQPGAVESVAEKEVLERPPQLFDLTSLQREANRRFGLTAAATLKAAQELYEEKLITYPRTDSRYLTRDLVPTLPAVVRSVGTLPEFAAAARGADLQRVHAGLRRVVDDAKVTDHHAIIPTTEVASGLSGVKAKIYGLIVRRFLAQFYPDARHLDLEVITRVGALPDRFRARGRRTLEPGWRAVEPETSARNKEREEEEMEPLPPLKQGESVRTLAVRAEEKTTRPPRRYTEATLLSAMEYAGREVTDEALREAMKERGLGTPATRAAIIERLKEVGYVTLENKALVPTPKGRQLVALAEAFGTHVLLSAELTGDWEKRIADIQAGRYGPESFMEEIRELAVRVVDAVRSGSATAVTGAPHPPGEHGSPGSPDSPGSPRSAGSPGPVRAQAAPLSARCPQCGGELTHGSKGWTCPCGLRIPGFLCGKVIDAALAATLLQKGRTGLITGFRSPRTGRSFAAFLVLKAGTVTFEFPPDKPGKGRSSRARRAGTAGRSKPTRSGRKRKGDGGP